MIVDGVAAKMRDFSCVFTSANRNEIQFSAYLMLAEGGNDQRKWWAVSRASISRCMPLAMGM